jgi:hypothetical protein
MSPPRNRHDPNEPMTTLCARMQERIVPSTGKPYRYGVGDSEKYLMFENGDGTWRLCCQPLSPEDRARIPEVESPPTAADLADAEARRRLAEPFKFVSGLPSAFLKRGPRE